jgi:lipoprotein NlpI
MGDKGKAMTDFCRAIELDSKAVHTYNARGLLHEAAKDYDAALADFSKAVELDSKQHVFYRNRGLCLRTVGRYAESAQDLERCDAIALDASQHRHEIRLCQSNCLAFSDLK